MTLKEEFCPATPEGTAAKGLSERPAPAAVPAGRAAWRTTPAAVPGWVKTARKPTIKPSPKPLPHRNCKNITINAACAVPGGTAHLCFMLLYRKKRYILRCSAAAMERAASCVR